MNEVDVCERLLLYILVIFVLIYVHFPCFYLIFEFLYLVHTTDSMIGNDRSLFTLFRFKHGQVKSCRSPSTSKYRDCTSLHWPQSDHLLPLSAEAQAKARQLLVNLNTGKKYECHNLRHLLTFNCHDKNVATTLPLILCNRQYTLHITIIKVHNLTRLVDFSVTSNWWKHSPGTAVPKIESINFK